VQALPLITRLPLRIRHYTLPPKPGVHVKIPQQTNAIDCGLFTLFFAEKFFLEPKGFVQKATNRETKEDDWDFEPAKMRQLAYQHLQPLAKATTTEQCDGDDEVDDDEVAWG
jgi:hypothetical protein